jgi:CRISPR-associated endonuclease/helicase Cas3
VMNPARLWAKSKREHEQEVPSMFLPGHLRDVYVAAEKVLDATGDEQLLALGLSPDEYRARLWRCVLLAAAVHDLGKANDHFQGMICGNRDVRQNPQGLRHEWVSVLMLRELREWLLPAIDGNASDFAFVEWAVAGHHPAISHASPPRNSPDGSGPEIYLHLGHNDFRSSLEWLAIEFKLDQANPLSGGALELGSFGQVFPVIKGWEKKAKQTWDNLHGKDKRLVAAVKDCLVAADVAGSALPKAAPKDPERWEWISTAFSDRPQPGELQSIVDRRLNGDTVREFQSAVANSTATVTFVKAGCGTGKTLAAYMWAAKNHSTRRLYFCYPTTGTATEGFKDYLFEPDGELGQIGAKLFHSRRDVDFEIILSTGADANNSEVDSAIRIESLDAWSTPIVACTVDTVLGIVQNNRRGLFAWPAFAQAAFVFDEIHAYDDRLFGALLRFLRDLPGLPVLLMTASLPKAREIALRTLLKDHRNIDLDPIAGPKELEALPRYERATVEDNDPMPLIRETLKKSGKVLWVCNTVSRVMDAADQSSNLTPLIYHSRFKYEDRVQRHKTVIDAYKRAGPTLAICSQVAEMSLDLSADLLVTDLAPVPALIQRLGRLNRRASPENAIPSKPFITVEPGTPLPYTSDDLGAARAWLAKIPADRISQKHLADAWEQTGDHSPELVDSAWLDGGPTTTVKELREGSHGITVLMEEDLPRVKNNHKETDKLMLPMLPTAGWERWPRECGLPIAPMGTIVYDRLRGASWRK